MENLIQYKKTLKWWIMKQERRKQKKWLPLCAGALLLVAGICLGIGLFRSSNGTGNAGVQMEVDPGAVEWQGILPSPTDSSGAGNITIPGYGAMTLAANTLNQRVNLVNPQGNPCYFCISLVVDGEVVYESKLIPPGKGVYDIQLIRTLPAGRYPHAVLRYQCYSLEESPAPLNGADVVLDLWVQ